MTDGIATLSLELEAPPLRRRSAPALDSSATLREYVLGPENALVRQGIGLGSQPAGAPPFRIDIVPLTLCAPSGLGKSQLLHALAATWTRHHAPDSVLLLTGADFVRGYASAVKVDDVPRFQQRFQRIDFLLIDDLDAYQAKSGAQQQLATIIEHRQRHQRPTVFSARRPLHALGLSNRLTSRLASGLVIPLQLPSTPTRQAILQRLCQARRIGLSTEAKRLLSESETITVPQLMGLLNQLRQQSQIEQRGWRRDAPTTEGNDRRPEIRVEDADVQKLLQSVGVEQIEAVDIIRTTARYFGLHPRNLAGSSRRKMDVLARSCAMYIMRTLTGASFQQIGRHFGDRDHTTVMHACKKVTANQKSDMTTRNALQEIQRRLGEQSLSRGT